MKKISVFLVIALAIVFAIGSVFTGCKSDANEIAAFGFKNNLQAEYGKDIPILFSIPEGLKKVELVYNDSVFQTWNNPQAGEIKLALQTNYFGVGTRPISLRSTDADGLVMEDNYFVRVISDKVPKVKKATIVKTYPHNTTSYTQGLEFYNGRLFEGTGDPGQQGKTLVGEISLQSGDFVGLKQGLDATHFGEGITLMNDKLYQLTWQNQKCFVYDINTMSIVKEFQYVGQGWGLTNDGELLVMSNGSEYITFRDPKTFNAVRTIQVYDNKGPRVALNELEYINGLIYANVYQTNVILVIEPRTGRVVEEIDATELVLLGQGSGDVLNGIAYNQTTKQLFMTGKYWSKLFEVKITD